jgi:Polysaccharide biosynthesis enzyme WcbI/Tetratricopeptide repeat
MVPILNFNEKAGRLVEFVAQLAFGLEGNASSYLGAGWSGPEPGFRWTIDDKSEIRIPVPGRDVFQLAIDVHPMVDRVRHPAQRITIEAGGITVLHAKVSQFETLEFEVPETVVSAENHIVLLIHHPDAIRPQALDRGDDQRRLAFAIREMRISAKGQTQPGDMGAAAETSLAAPGIVQSDARASIIFVGNCQMGALTNIYRRALPEGHDHDVIYLASYVDATEEAARKVASADILVQQIIDFVPQIGDLPTQGKVVLVPHISAAFLWPNAGTPHPINKPEPLIDQSGPYNAELGDSFLNRLIANNTAPSEALSEYLAADVATARRAERMMELHLQKQHDRDAVCGIAIADYIEARFRTQKLFRSRSHPVPDMMLWVAEQVFSNMDMGGARVHALASNMPDVLPPSETPIHPAVAAQFGLTYAPPDRRYRFFHEGSFTFAEYVVRYMRYEWNAPLAEGMDMLRRGHAEDGVAMLRSVLPSAPYSAIARMMMADALEKLGHLEEAVEYYCQALELDPGNLHYENRLFYLSDQFRKRVAS